MEEGGGGGGGGMNHGPPSSSDYSSEAELQQRLDRMGRSPNGESCCTIVMRRLFALCGEGGQRKPLLPNRGSVAVEDAQQDWSELNTGTSNGASTIASNGGDGRGLLRRRAEGCSTSSTTHEIDRAVEEGLAYDKTARQLWPATS